jgi:hypothetical protein
VAQLYPRALGTHQYSHSKFILIYTYEYSIRTSQETHYVSATETNRLLLYGETVTVYCENHTEHTDTLCGQNAGSTLREIRIQYLTAHKVYQSPLYPQEQLKALLHSEGQANCWSVPHCLHCTAITAKALQCAHIRQKPQALSRTEELPSPLKFCAATE